jgi:hypothetical protein
MVSPNIYLLAYKYICVCMYSYNLNTDFLILFLPPPPPPLFLCYFTSHVAEIKVPTLI